MSCMPVVMLGQLRTPHTAPTLIGGLVTVVYVKVQSFSPKVVVPLPKLADTFCCTPLAVMVPLSVKEPAATVVTLAPTLKLDPDCVTAQPTVTTEPALLVPLAMPTGSELGPIPSVKTVMISGNVQVLEPLDSGWTCARTYAVGAKFDEPLHPAATTPASAAELAITLARSLNEFAPALRAMGRVSCLRTNATLEG